LILLDGVADVFEGLVAVPCTELDDARSSGWEGVQVDVAYADPALDAAKKATLERGARQGGKVEESAM